MVSVLSAGKGNGPCNEERVEARRKAWDDGQWVREAAMAHAVKMNNLHFTMNNE